MTTARQYEGQGYSPERAAQLAARDRARGRPSTSPAPLPSRRAVEQQHEGARADLAAEREALTRCQQLLDEVTAERVRLAALLRSAEANLADCRQQLAGATRDATAAQLERNEARRVLGGGLSLGGVPLSPEEAHLLREGLAAVTRDPDLRPRLGAAAAALRRRLTAACS